ncbi:zinc finger, CCHC-type containing protein [Tanacetum coccineum]|uniref:Zinc finger, CCHC-type containing protein n=1 Tax=Tanacetum coccineum TaxID=301880 RepID=A0ABQ5I760_9ASTR
MLKGHYGSYGYISRDSKNKDSYDRRRRNPGNQNYHRRDIREIECYNCHEFGHYAANCPKPDCREEKANLVFEDDEPALLMVTSKDEKEITSLKEEKRRNEIVIENDEIPKEKSEDMRSEIEIDLKSKLEFWKFEMLQELEMEKQEFEKKIRNREMAFEKQMQRELENLKKLRDCISKRMKELKSEREQFEKENHGVILDKKLLEEERVDNGECKKHRETPSIFQKESQIEKDKKVESEDRDTRNSVLEIQEYEIIQMKKDDKDDQDDIKDKEDRRPIKEKIQDIFSIEDQDKRSGNKPKFKEQDLLQSVQDKDDEA